ncbi:sugar nucleotide-binding protein [Clostridium felsineum]|uniref:sugar nucleotide-binding protein n=1 Tax=Clostridium felsineum TaxID=36839 RepID=UPI00098BEB80|nr:sugar nucleotide-binding protein [Clostridium felsineum]URZ17927.1 dTDP-4-dehydrorhamnose reductase [Clostridium felsineum DSM 794]
MLKVLILGGSGLVGSSIIKELTKYNNFKVYATYFKNKIYSNLVSSFNLDIKNLEGINNLLNKVQPDIVISCLRGDFKAQLILHTKTAEFLKKHNGKFYFFSTTNVFDGNLNTPHYENDIPNSQTEYGKYKIECEKMLINLLGSKSCILRIPAVWAKNSKRMDKLISTLKDNKEIILYPKLFINTNTDVIIAKQLCHIIRNDLKGIFHLTSSASVNYKDFYIKLIEQLGFKNARILESFEEKGYFSILSTRSNEFPSDLIITNDYVISYLTK